MRNERSMRVIFTLLAVSFLFTAPHTIASKTERTAEVFKGRTPNRINQAIIVGAEDFKSDLDSKGCEWLSYNESAAYYWNIPDMLGDDYYNLRFTFSQPCTLKTLAISFYESASYGSPGAEFILYHSDGTFPTDTVAVYPVGTVTTWYPEYESMDISGDNIIVNGDFHLGYTPIYNGSADTLACLSDDGSSGSERSSYLYGSAWRLMSTDYGVDVNFLMQVEVCEIDRSVWHVATDGSDITGDGSEENPFKTIQYAIDIAESTDTILVHEGTYYEHLVIDHEELTLASEYILDQNPSHIAATIIDGDNSGRVVEFVFDFDGYSSPASLIGLTLRNGSALVERGLCQQVATSRY